MTLNPAELWGLLTLVMGVLMSVAIVITSRYYNVVTDIPEVSGNKHVQLYFKLMFTTSLAPSIVGFAICLIMALNLK